MLSFTYDKYFETVAIGIHLLFLPPYSPDFSPIEESFSCGE